MIDDWSISGLSDWWAIRLVGGSNTDMNLEEKMYGSNKYDI